MRYAKCFLYSFLVVFFANYLLPGVETTDQTKLPHIGGDLVFAFALGLLNGAVFPVLKALHRHQSILKMGVVILILNFLAYALTKLLPIGISLLSVEGYLLVSFVCALGSFLINFLESKHSRKEGGSPPAGDVTFPPLT